MLERKLCLRGKMCFLQAGLEKLRLWNVILMITLHSFDKSSTCNRFIVLANAPL